MTEENLYGHLLSPEFFDAEQHPEIIFESKKISSETATSWSSTAS